MRITGIKRFLLALAVTICFAPVTSAGEKTRPHFTQKELEPLLQSLQDEGMPRPILNDIFYDERLRKIDRVVRMNGVNPDFSDRYEQFYSRYAVAKAKRFKRKHYELLRRAEKEFGVPMNIIVAILLVETQFGTYPLGYRVLEVFTTLVVEANHEAIERHYIRIKARYPEIEKAYFANRVTSKAEWAYRELVALLAMERYSNTSLYDLKGSYAGAFGMPQFLPSSYVRWATDGNQDGLVNLDHTADAIVSIANYLREHGWSRGASLAKKMQAIWSYNHSDHYVNAIFEISRRMVIPPHKSRRNRTALQANAGWGLG